MEEDKINVLCNSCKIFPWRIQLWFLSILMRRRSENIIFKPWNELVSGDHKIFFYPSECNAEIVLFEKKMFIYKLYWWYFCIWILFHGSTYFLHTHIYGVRIQRIRIQSIAIYISGWRDCLLLWWCCFLQHLRSPPPRLILNMVTAVLPMAVEVMVATLGSAADSAEHNHPPQPKPAVLDDKML